MLAYDCDCGKVELPPSWLRHVRSRCFYNSPRLNILETWALSLAKLETTRVPRSCISCDLSSERIPPLRSYEDPVNTIRSEYRARIRKGSRVGGGESIWNGATSMREQQLTKSTTVKVRLRAALWWACFIWELQTLK